MLVCMTGVALAGDPAGSWTSSSGSRIDLWANMEQVVVTVTDSQGVQHRYQGAWTRFSDYFAYQVGSTRYSCAFRGSNEIVVNAPGKATVVWTRGWSGRRRPTAPPAQGGGDPSGLYASSSGSSVQLSSRGGQVFVTIVTSRGQRINGSGNWVSARRFEYRVPGNPGKGVCTLDANNPNVIYVQSNSGTSTWTRQ